MLISCAFKSVQNVRLALRTIATTGQMLSAAAKKPPAKSSGKGGACKDPPKPDPKACGKASTKKGDCKKPKDPPKLFECPKGDNGAHAGDHPDKPFKWTDENKQRIDILMKLYPDNFRKGALVPLLDLAQRQYGWVSISAQHHIADYLGIPKIKVYDAVKFYRVFNHSPRARFNLQICSSVSCYLNGGDEILKTAKKELGIHIGQNTKDMRFTITKTVCVGACANAPIVIVNDDYYEDLTPKDLKNIIADLKRNCVPPAGPRCRFASEPKGKPTSLCADPNCPGFGLQKALK